MEILLAQYSQKVWHAQNRESLTKVDSGLAFGYIRVKYRSNVSLVLLDELTYLANLLKAADIKTQMCDCSSTKMSVECNGRSYRITLDAVMDSLKLLDVKMSTEVVSLTPEQAFFRITGKNV